jgi:(p)ppGpp synthase/HD superfamily hydrolase
MTTRPLTGGVETWHAFSNMPTPTLEDAILLAANAHRGQTDKAGIAYITHPLRVMSMFVLPEEENERMVAVLHDVVEDTVDITCGDLVRWRYPTAVTDAIFAISRIADESYPEYIERVALNPLALRVKIADLVDNLNEARVSTGMLHPETKRKYRDAMRTLHAHEALAAISARSTP